MVEKIVILVFVQILRSNSFRNNRKSSFLIYGSDNGITVAQLKQQFPDLNWIEGRNDTAVAEILLPKGRSYCTIQVYEGDFAELIYEKYNNIDDDLSIEFANLFCEQ